MIFSFLWVCLVLSAFTVSFSPPSPHLCPAPSFSPTPLLRPSPLRCVRRVRANIRSALLSPALPPKSLSSPLASCLSFMSFLPWLCLSLKSTLLAFFFYIKSHHSLHPDTLILTLSSRIRTSYVTQILQFERFFSDGSHKRLHVETVFTHMPHPTYIQYKSIYIYEDVSQQHVCVSPASQAGSVSHWPTPPPSILTCLRLFHIYLSACLALSFLFSGYLLPAETVLFRTSNTL